MPENVWLRMKMCYAMLCCKIYGTGKLLLGAQANPMQAVNAYCLEDGRVTLRESVFG
jgi:hypothetical protein